MPPLTITITAKPSWLPVPLADQLAGSRITVSFTQPERRVFRRKKPIRPSVWAAKHRVLTDGPLAGARMDMSMTPHAAGIMDASFFPSVRYIVNCKNVQSAGTTTIHTCIAYAADRCPGNTLIAFPDRDRAGKASKDRLQPMITKSNVLRELMTGVDDDMSSLRIKLSNMLIYLGWSGSSTSLGDFPARYVVKEEADKWQEFANKSEAGSHDSIDQRVTTFADQSKIWDNSTCTTESGHIWQALTTATEFVFDFWVKCPDCSQHQIMIFKNIEWPDGSAADPVEVDSKKLARYYCNHCGSEWSDHRRDQAARAGEWRGVPTKEWLKKYDSTKEGDNVSMADAEELFACLKQHRPAAIGFHPTAYHSPFVSLSKAAAAFLHGIGDTPEARKALKSFLNNFAAEPWKHYHQDRKEDKILALRDDRPRGMVPGGDVVACLLGSADTQDNGFYYEIRAWGYGFERESWLVREGFVDSLNALAKVLFDTSYPDADGNKYQVMASVIDAMGHRTKEVYDFCRLHRGKIVPLKGEERRSNKPYWFTKREFYPGTSVAIPGGIQLLHIDTHYYKDDLAAKLAIAPEDPGAYHLHANYTEEWAKMMCAEVVNDKMLWENPTSAPNHPWDVAVYNVALADLLDVQLIEKPAAVANETAPTDEDSGEWVGAGESWL